MQKHIQLMLIVLTSTSLIACIKVENKYPKADKTEMLCMTPWDLTRRFYNDTVLTQFQPCELDNVYHVYPNGNWIMSPGAELCHTSDTFDVLSKWEFAAKETQIVFNPGTSFSKSFEILELNEHRFWIKEISISHLQMVFER